MNTYQLTRKQYWVLLVVFSFCAVVGLASIAVAELFMPNNAGGNLGRLAMYRYLGMGSVAWASIAVWVGYKLRVLPLLNGK